MVKPVFDGLVRQALRETHKTNFERCVESGPTFYASVDDYVLMNVTTGQVQYQALVLIGDLLLDIQDKLTRD